MSVYKGMLEASVLTITDTGEPIVPYFNKDQLTTYVSEYLDQNISRYTTDYNIETTYYNPTTNKVCNASICRQIRLRLVAKINTFYSYDKTQTFTVRSYTEIWTRN